ncbi:MAG TPA: TetR/AcrR family transcriptional regulator C-terminal domain-containing protein, partial [Devosiaceae bacterium]|nr:TetR/AcrR family transcriptional regulator C-terminal domain-containing protein [Devosiaceae bacterium]
TAGEAGLTPRQGDVLDVALSLLVEAGEGFTMTALARRASCSKETLYKWFGDRDGLLTATVQYQAAKVRVVPVDAARLDAEGLADALTRFATDLLTVLTGEISVALNRLAVAHAGADRRGLGAVVLQNGRHAIGRRLKPVLEAGRAAGLLDFSDAEAAFRTYFGLVVRDIQIRLMLGDQFDISAKTIAAEATTAVEQFLVLCGTGGTGRAGA